MEGGKVRREGEGGNKRREVGRERREGEEGGRVSS